ncbi:MAG: hypothetical protein ACI9L9_000387 [Marivirga sp.]|jgi:hypothetical protein
MDETLKILTVVLNQLLSKADRIYSSLDPCFVGESITDSFTVLVGLVAIGIPLSLQVISRATEKYKSDHLIMYLSSWKWVTPKRIYWVSIFYILFGLMFKSLLPLNVEDCGSLDFQPYAWILIIVFLALVVAVGFWYGHLFSQASKRPKEIYDALKK